jgi:hypothetical protein
MSFRQTLLKWGPAAITLALISAIISTGYFRQDFMFSLTFKVLDNNLLTLIWCALATPVFVFGLFVYWAIQALFQNSLRYSAVFRGHAYTQTDDQLSYQGGSLVSSSQSSRRMLSATVKDHAPLTDGDSSSG